MLPRVIAADNHINRYLLSAQTEVSNLMPLQSKMPGYGLATWIDGTEVRVGTNDDTEYNYSLRARPKFSSERSAEANLKLLEFERRGLAHETILGDALKSRYHVLIDILAYQATTEILMQEVSLYKIKVKLYRSLLQTKEVDPERLQEAESKHFLIEQQIQLNSERLAHVVKLYGLPELMGGSFSHSTWAASIPSMSQIIESVTNYDAAQGGLEQFSRLKHKSLDLRVAQEDFNLSKAQINSLVKFVELKYVDRRQQTDKSEISLSFAIPIGGGRSKLARRQNDLDRAKLIYEQNQFQAVQNMRKVRSDLYLLDRQSKSIQRALLRNNQTLSNLQETNNPLLTMMLKQEKISHKKKLWECHLQALRNYIEFLHASGQLTSMPLRNRLFKNEPLLIGGAQ